MFTWLYEDREFSTRYGIVIAGLSEERVTETNLPLNSEFSFDCVSKPTSGDRGQVGDQSARFSGRGPRPEAGSPDMGLKDFNRKCNL
jgi:hypothetical protein